jgi:hypothetical protein
MIPPDSSPERLTDARSAVRAAQPDGIVVFVHIPRTAGQTLSSIIARCYRQGEVFNYRGSIVQEIAIPEARKSSLRLIKGHFAYGIHEQFDAPCTYITFLRDPVQRVASLFRYTVANQKHPLHASVKAMSFEEFVTSGIDAVEVENGQTRQLSGIADAVPGHIMLEAAIRHLEESFTVAGITERFDESLLLLRGALRWPLRFYRITNASGVAQGDISPEGRRLVEARNDLDLQLYDAAVELFERRLARQGSILPAKLAAFRVFNKTAQVYRRASRRPSSSPES